MPAFGWGARVVAISLRRMAWEWSKLAAYAQRYCMIVSFMIKTHVIYDRQIFLEQRARDAQRAASYNDWRGLYAIVRSLGGIASSSTPRPVKQKDGSLTSSEDARQLRWQEHFRDVFGGQATSMETLRAIPIEHPVKCEWVMTTDDTVAAWKQLGRNKEAGRDGLPSELLLVLAQATAVPATILYNETIERERWPTRWTGGRMQEIFKNKGCRDICDDYRGIVLEDHLAKGLKQHLSHAVGPAYNAAMPDCQHGAVGGRSTDFATHLVREVIAYAAASRLCLFVLFIDLVKAFDRVIREITLGWPAEATDPRAYLQSLGLSDDQAAWIATFVSQHGCLFEQWGVDPKVVRLLKNMHVQSWFSCGDVDEAIATRVGGRQGCKYGSPIFNSTFSVAIILVHDALVDADVVLQLAYDGAAVWTPTPPCSESPKTDVLDAAFVDDTVLFLLSKSASGLDDAIQILLTLLLRIYHLMNLEINWSPGKTEAILVYRGRGAVERLRARRPAAFATPRISVPGSNSILHIVSVYKHLGGEITAAGSLVPLAHGRRKRALAAYSPLAMKIFGSLQLKLDLKQWMFTTLVMSRLVFNLHVVVPSRRFLIILNDVYLRGHRRMHDACRIDKECESDLAFRVRTLTPSIDCILCRARLRYLGRIARSHPPSLVTLLRQRVNGRRPAWVELVVSDMTRMRQTVARCASLPPPDSDPDAWMQRSATDPRSWAQDVSVLYFTDSVCDREAVPGISSHARPFACSECSVAFSSEKQLALHLSRHHGIRCQQRLYAAVHSDGTATCPVCGTTFSGRIALLKHLCDKRRDLCWNTIVATPKKFCRLTERQLMELDESDRLHRKTARSMGHSHPVSSGVLRKRDA